MEGSRNSGSAAVAALRTLALGASIPYDFHSQQPRMSSDALFDLGMRLLSACSEGNLEGVGSLLRFGADPSFPGPKGQTPLNAVAVADSVPSPKRAALIRRLVRAGALVSRQNESGASALLLAARHPEVQRALSEAGANTELLDKNGDTVLIWTVSVNRAPSIEHLIAAGADVSRSGRYPRTPLAYAAYRGNAAYARSLIAAGAQVDSRDVDGTTPLMTALLMRQTEVALVLADAGADLRARNHAGASIIWCAARANHAAILQRARACGEKLNYVTEALLRLSGLRVSLLRKLLLPAQGAGNAPK